MDAMRKRVENKEKETREELDKLFQQNQLEEESFEMPEAQEETRN